jgi:PAS domain S-box-containing protein
MTKAMGPSVIKPLRERFRLIVEGSEDGIAVNEAGQTVCVSDRLCEIFGYSRLELAGMGELDLAAPEERPKLQRTMQEVYRRGVPLQELEFWAVRKDGSRCYIRNHYSRGRIGEGAPLGLVVTSDLTEQITVEQAALGQEASLQPKVDAKVSGPSQDVRAADGVLADQAHAGVLPRAAIGPVGETKPALDRPREQQEDAVKEVEWAARAEEQEVVKDARAEIAPHAWIQIGGEWRLFSMTEVPGPPTGPDARSARGPAAEEVADQTWAGLVEVWQGASEALALASDEEAMLGAVAGPAVETGAHAASLLYMEVDEDGEPEWAEVVAVLGETTAPVGTRLYLPDSPLTDLLLSSPDRPLMIADLDVPYGGVNEALVRMMKGVEARAFAVIPLRAGESWQGVVTIAWPEPHQFSSGTEQLYSLMGSQLAFIVQGQRMRKEVDHRAAWSQTAAEVSRAAGTLMDPDELLQEVVNLVQGRFGLYYAGLFLVDGSTKGSDESEMWAVLRVGTGEVGRKMAEQGHRLRIGGRSMIGQCLDTGQPRIAMDVSREAVRFDNPLLPETRTELALPLVSRGQALGALTLQSNQRAAFSAEDIAVLQIMADQLAIAIDNATLIGQAQARADREQRVRAITERIRRGSDMESIMRNTLEELSQMLGASNAVIRLGTQAQLSLASGGRPLLSE